MNTEYESSALDAVSIRQLARSAAATYRGSYAGSTMHGWLLGKVAEEGAIDNRYGNWEAGFIYVLRADGVLVWSEYRVEGNSAQSDDVLTDGRHTLEPISDDGMTWLDRPNLGDYEVTTADEDHRRMEILRNFQITAEVKGATIREAIERVQGEPRSLDNSSYRNRGTAAARRLDRERPKRILGHIFGLLLLAVPVWIFTPVVAYIAVNVDHSPSLYHTFFWNGKHREGDIYPLLAILLPSMIICLGILAFVFPYKRDEEVVSAPAFFGFGAGIVLLLYQAFSGSGGEYSWFWPPLFAVIGHLTLGLVRAKKN